MGEELKVVTWEEERGLVRSSKIIRGWGFEGASRQYRSTDPGWGVERDVEVIRGGGVVILKS